MSESRPFIYATYDDIKKGKTTDIYFIRTVKILEKEGLGNVEVCAEFTASGFPRGYSWAFLGGLRDVAKLLEGLPVDVDAMLEGTLFYETDYYGIKEPIMVIRGPYAKFAIYETPILGFLAAGSGILTKAARIRKVAGEKVKILSFGARRAHPAISPFNDFYAYVGGCDAVSCVISAEEFLRMKPVGTMPHSLVIIFKVYRGRIEDAWIAFDKHVEADVPRIMLTDTFYDEKIEAVMAAQTLKDKIYGVRLDTPSSRRGNFAAIVREVKWELKTRGFDNVKIIVSGGIDEHNIPELIEAGADGFGVGAAIANAPLIDVAMDVVAVKKDGKWVPIAKRGKFAGIKQVYRCPECLVDIVKLEGEEPPKCPKCGSDMEPMLKPLIRNGEIVREFPSPSEEREYVLSQLRKIQL